MDFKAIPFPEPVNQEEGSNILKLIEYVKRNGTAFEEKVKSKEMENPKFSFLYQTLNEPGYRYYKWRLFLAVNEYTTDEIKDIEEKHKIKIKSSQPGSLRLTYEDQSLLMSLLSINTGSKDSIRSIRKWILDRAHSLASIVSVICNQYLKSLLTSPEMCFAKCLHVIYIINDLLFNSSSVTTDGIYTKIFENGEYNETIEVFKILFPYMPWLLQTAYRFAVADAEKERVLRMITLWVNKQFIDNQLGEQLTKLVLANDSSCQIPPVLNLISPYPEVPHSKSTINTTTSTTNSLLNSIAPPPMLVVPTMQQQQYFPQPLQAPFPYPPGFQLQQQQLQMQQLQMQQQLQLSGITLGQHSVIMPPQIPPPHSMMIPPPHVHHPPIPTAAAVPPPFSFSGQSNISSHFLPMLDLTKTPVGAMADIVKGAVKTGHPRYQSIDITAISNITPAHVEPGRLDIRISEFYKKAEAIKQSQ